MSAAAALHAARAFALGAEPTHATPLGEGHIHGTWRVDTDRAGSYVLQRLNEDVFPALDAVMANVVRVTEHLRRSLETQSDRDRRCLRLVPTHEGAWLHRDADAAPWRAYVYIERTRSFQTVPSVEIAQEAARAFGAFAVACADLETSSLETPLPGFHDFDARYAGFERAVSADPLGRSHDARETVELARSGSHDLREALRDHDLAAQPERIVHNDCKLNNVLFDAERPQALCVIDLDTVMPGRLVHDFGDLGRTASCAQPEDSTDLDRVVADPRRLEALCEGYLDATRAIATPAELDLLPLAGPLITLETGLRFLTDHLEGDAYFGARRPGQNLDRARMQLRLFRSLLEAQSVVRRAVAP